MKHERTGHWKEIVLGVIAGLSLAVSPVAGQMTDPNGEPTVRLDNRGPGSVNSGKGSLNSGPGLGNSGRRDGHDQLVAQSADVRQEDRRRTVEKTDVPIGNRVGAKTGRPIGGKIAGRTRAVKSWNSIEPIRSPANMAGKGETTLERLKWIGRIDRNG